MTIPRPEHPRPDRYRENYLNLNGVWEFAFESQEAGIKAGYHGDSGVLPRKINVPFVPESRMSGIHDESFHKTCWYKRSFELPHQMQSGRILLHFGAVDHYAKIWLNGVLIGDHKGGYSSFYFDITDQLRPGNNVLCVMAEDDPAVNKCRGKQMPFPHLYAKGCRYMRMTGIWQTVWLEQVGTVFIDDFRISTDIRKNTVKIIPETVGAYDGEMRVKAKVFLGSESDYYVKARKSVKLNVAKTTGLSVRLEDPMLWTPDAPNIYYLRLELEDASGSIVDSVLTYFGMREISIKGDKVYLNGEQIYLIGALDQGIYPESLYTPPSDEAQKKDVLLAKQCGLNWIRKHQIMPEARFFYWCDRLGLMAWAEMPDWGGARDAYTEDGFADISAYNDDEYISEMKETFMRDINHPSIIGWCCNNERTAADDPENTRSKKRIYDAMKALDSSRMVIDNSGYCHAETDICDFHIQWHQKHAKGKQIIRDLSEEGNSMLTSDRSRPAYCEPYKWRGEPIVISETGNWNIVEYPPEGDWEPYGAPVLTVEDWIQLYRDYISYLILNKSLSGFCYVQLYDTEGENNGYYTYSREVKVPVEQVRLIHEKVLAMRLES